MLLLARDLRVAFTNNLAGGDLRPTKTQLKISGCHRASGGAQAWLRIRGYISTMHKNGAPILTGLRDAITGNPGPQLQPEWLRIRCLRGDVRLGGVSMRVCPVAWADGAVDGES